MGYPLMQTLHNPAADEMSILILSVETLHFLAGALSGRQFLPLNEGNASWPAQAGTQNFILYAECFSRAKTDLIIFNKIIILTYLPALASVICKYYVLVNTQISLMLNLFGVGHWLQC